MSFDTLPFVALFAITWLFALHPLFRGWVLLAASLVVYAFAGWTDSVLFAAVLGINYLFSLRIAARPAWLAPAIGFNLLVLAAFKYRSLILGGELAGSFVGDIAIPLGISFYTFQSIAYLVDIRRGHVTAEPSFARFVLFKAFFAQLIAGPIVRAHQFIPQITRLFEGRGRRHRLVGLGLALCLLGLFKKVVLSDSLSPHVDLVFAHGPADAATAWLGAWLFAFQIYFDFSGYSDMAVGMAWLVGIRLPVNFRTPYLATSPREFWQCWHMTLSQWIRDYLYLPLGGSRVGGPIRQTSVLVGVMGLAGLWHGANWTFLIWGLLWGLLIAGWRVVPSRRGTKGRFGTRLAGWFATMVAVLLLWVVFRAPNAGFALDYISTMLGIGSPAGAATMVGSSAHSLLVAAGAASLMALQVIEHRATGIDAIRRLRHMDGPLLRGALVTTAVWLVLLPKSGANPFIYFRF